MITGIKNNSDSITRYALNLDSEEGSTYCNIMKKTKSDLLEEAAFTWFFQKQASGPILCEKAVELIMWLGGDSSFIASFGD